jgi:hypothetical protein
MSMIFDMVIHHKHTYRLNEIYSYILKVGNMAVLLNLEVVLDSLR